MTKPRVSKLTWHDWYLTWKEYKPPAPTFTEKDLKGLNGKVVVISGGSGGIGYETIKMIAANTNASIYTFVRRLEDSQKIFTDLKQEINKPNAVIEPIYLDFNDLTTVKPAAEELLSKIDRLDIMIHNAAVMDVAVEYKTVQRWNKDLQINAFGCFALQNLLNPIMAKTSNKAPLNSVRIVWVGSMALYFAPDTILNFEDPNYDHTKPFYLSETYGQSKAVQALFSNRWRNEYKDMNKVVSVYCCPGYLATDLSRHQASFTQSILKKVLNPPKFGGYTLLWCAFSDQVGLENDNKYVAPYGRFAEFKKPIEDNFNSEIGDKVWNFVVDNVKDFY